MKDMIGTLEAMNDLQKAQSDELESRLAWLKCRANLQLVENKVFATFRFEEKKGGEPSDKAEKQ